MIIKMIRTIEMTTVTRVKTLIRLQKSFINCMSQVWTVDLGSRYARRKKQLALVIKLTSRDIFRKFDERTVNKTLGDLALAPGDKFSSVLVRQSYSTSRNKIFSTFFSVMFRLYWIVPLIATCFLEQNKSIKSAREARAVITQKQEFEKQYSQTILLLILSRFCIAVS